MCPWVQNKLRFGHARTPSNWDREVFSNWLIERATVYTVIPISTKLRNFTIRRLWHGASQNYAWASKIHSFSLLSPDWDIIGFRNVQCRERRQPTMSSIPEGGKHCSLGIASPLTALWWRPNSPKQANFVEVYPHSTIMNLLFKINNIWLKSLIF